MNDFPRSTELEMLALEDQQYEQWQAHQDQQRERAEAYVWSYLRSAKYLRGVLAAAIADLEDEDVTRLRTLMEKEDPELVGAQLIEDILDLLVAQHLGGEL
jgi:hypothetical protein